MSKIIAYLNENDICVNRIIVEEIDIIFLDRVLIETQEQFGAVKWVDSTNSPSNIGNIFPEPDYPTDGKLYFWDKENQTWVEVTN
jgi:hypothetical protein